MGKNVYANGLEIAGRASDHLVIAAMPDVCLSPPAPPAGPLPIPYPDSSKSKDLQAGSKDVSIGTEPVCLGSKSHYLSAPLGDEASTKSFGANVIDHGNAGKTYCQAHSMNVSIESEPVTRTGDITTSNHTSAQPAGAAVPMVQVAGVAPPGGGTDGPEQILCECCGAEAHSEAQKHGQAMTASEWYNPPYKPNNNPPSKRDKRALQEIADAQAAIELSREAGCDNMHPDDSDDPCAKHYVMKEKVDRKEYETLVSPTVSREYLIEQYGETVGSRAFANSQRLKAFKAKGAASIAHKTPLAAGGCPIGANNTSPVYGPDCEYLEKTLGYIQQSIKDIHSGTFR